MRMPPIVAIAALLALTPVAGIAHAAACTGRAPAGATEFRGPVLEVLDGARLCVALSEEPSSWVEVRLGAGEVSGVARIGEIEHTFARVPVTGQVARLEVRSVPPRSGGPDDLELAAHAAGSTIELGRLDGRYLSSEVAGGFTGRVWGVRAVNGTAVVRRLAVGPIETAPA